MPIQDCAWFSRPPFSWTDLYSLVVWRLDPGSLTWTFLAFKRKVSDISRPLCCCSDVVGSDSGRGAKFDHCGITGDLNHPWPGMEQCALVGCQRGRSSIGPIIYVIFLQTFWQIFADVHVSNKNTEKTNTTGSSLPPFLPVSAFPCGVDSLS